MVDIDLLPVVRTLEELVDCRLLSLLNIELDEICLDKGNHIFNKHFSALILLYQRTKWREFRILKFHFFVYIFS